MIYLRFPLRRLHHRSRTATRACPLVRRRDICSCQPPVNTFGEQLCGNRCRRGRHRAQRTAVTKNKTGKKIKLNTFRVTLLLLLLYYVIHIGKKISAAKCPVFPATFQDGSIYIYIIMYRRKKNRNYLYILIQNVSVRQILFHVRARHNRKFQ